ncbi:uncharacterized protein LOC144162788 [Haemaphysalis longicornis]
MPCCSVIHCCNKPDDGKRLMRFPLGKKAGERLRAWLQLVGRDDFKPTPSSRICEDHFEADQYEGHRADGRKLLKWNAVPTIPACENARGRSRSIIAQKPDNGISAITGAQGAPPEVCVPQVCVVQPRTPGAAIGVLQNNPTTPSTAEVSGVRAPSPDVMQGDGYVVPLLTVEVEVQTGACAVEAETMDFSTSMPDEPTRGVHGSCSTSNQQCAAGTTDQAVQTEAPCSGPRCVHEATVEELKRKLDLQQKQTRKLEKQLEAVIGNKVPHLAPDQVLNVGHPDSRGNRWSDKTVQKALQVRLACGTRGYELLKDEVLPLPSERTLQRRIEDVKFEPGILNELLPALKAKLETMKPEERHCALLIDEMQLTAGLDFDPTVKKPIGLATAPLVKQGPEGELVYATHGLVVMLTGLSSRWKQVVAYHFTGDSIDGTFLKDVVFRVIEECEAAGCHVDAVISDMGSSNKALWKCCGIRATRVAEPVVSCRHPCAANTNRQLYFLADAPHVLKNIRGHLVRGQSIFLSKETVAKYKLPTREVSVEHIKLLAEEDAKRDLKLAPHLKAGYLDLNHFEKMSVSSAVAVLNHSVGAAMRVLVKMGLLPLEALTTAWFVEQVFRWFTLMTSRYIGTAMSLFKETSHEDAVAFLQEFMEMFSGVSIRNEKQKDCFKPVQTGVLISTTSALLLQHELLSVYNFKFVLLCRLTQDALENLFSCVRAKNPVPRALEFKLTLRLIMLSQFFRPSRKGSYQIDDSVDLLEFLEVKAASKESLEAGEEVRLDDSFLDDATPLDDVEMESLVYLSGYITRSVSKRYALCNTCKAYLKDEPIAESDQLLQLKSYRAQSQPNPLVRPSAHVVRLLTHADTVFRSFEHDALNVSLPALTKATLDSYQLPNDFPQCHQLGKHLTSSFLMLRLRITLRKLSCKAKAAKSKCASKSVGMRAAVSQVR